VDPRLAGLALTSGWVPVTVDVTAVLLMLVVVILSVVDRRRPLRALPIAAGLGILVGLGLCWLLTDALDLFGVSLSPVSRAWVAAAFGGAGVAIVALARPGRPRRVLAGLAIPAVLLAGAFGVNADFGQYPTVGSLTGHPVAAPLPGSVLLAQAVGAPGSRSAAATGPAAPLWRSPASGLSRQQGLLGTVSIPATTSNFPARPAYIYLPPAALVAHPAALPVLILLGGQPGGPANMIESGEVRQSMDAFAAAHHGLAPIVVAPDQLSAPQVNPMCVDSPIGNSATYLTVDVPRWIRDHLTVETSPAAWAIGGFSQGGTCSAQFAAAHPGLFGGMIDICGEIAPTNGDVRQTIDRGFGGSTAAYRAALPLTIIAATKPYTDSVAVVACGQFDTLYGAQAHTLAGALAAAGMRTTLVDAPGTAHDWHTVQWVLRTQLDPIYRHLGLEGVS